MKYLVKTYRLDQAGLEGHIATYYKRYHQTLYAIRYGKITDILIEPVPGLKGFLTTLLQQRIKIGLVTSSLKEEADEMIAAAEKAGVKLMVAENQRFWPSAIKASHFIDQRLLGSTFLIRVYEMWYYKPMGWRCSKQRVGGGNLIDSGIRAVNTLRLLAGSNAAQVFALNTGIVLQEMEGEDTNLVVKFQNGAMGNLITSWGIPASGPQVHFAVYGTEGYLWQQAENLFLHSRRLPEGLSHHKEPAPVQVPSVNIYEAECAHFVDCILQDKQPITNGREARKDLEIVAAAYQSAKTGKAVELPL